MSVSYRVVYKKSNNSTILQHIDVNKVSIDQPLRQVHFIQQTIFTQISSSWGQFLVFRSLAGFRQNIIAKSKFAITHLQYVSTPRTFFLSTSPCFGNISSSNYFFLTQCHHTEKPGFPGPNMHFRKTKKHFFCLNRQIFNRIDQKMKKNRKRGRPKAVPSQPRKIIYIFIFFCTEQPFQASVTPTTSHIPHKNFIFYTILIRLLSRLTNLTPFTSTHTQPYAY